MIDPSPFDEQLSSIEDPATALAGLLARAPGAMAICAADGRVVLHNQAFVDLVGPDLSAALGAGASQDFRGSVRRAFQGETLRLVACWLVRAAPGAPGERRAVEPTVFPLRDRAGQIRYAATAFKDVTAQLECEELRVRVAHLERQNQRIREASRHKSEFLASMSHELRTPLNGIIGFAQVLHDGQVDPAAPEHREFLGDILASSRHLLHLLNDVLDLAKIEAGKIDLRPEPVHVGELVAEVCGSLRGMATGKQIQTVIEVDPGLCDVSLDPARFKQVLYNYVSNAIKFTPAGGRVSLRVAPEGVDALRVEVEDTGMGISPSDMTRLFVEFEQVGSGMARRQHGTGLGLALTRRIVEAQGGKVGVRSVFKEGSVFYAILPKRPEHAGAGPRSEQDALAPIVLTSRG